MSARQTAKLRIPRPVAIAVLCASPVVILLGVWLLLDEVVFVPGEPGATASAADVVAYIIDDKGLPRMSSPRVQPFFEAQSVRMAKEPAFREQFLSTYRTSSPEERTAFRTHLFDILKPMIMRDVEQFHALKEQERDAFLNERYVDRKRLEILWAGIRVEKSAADAADLQRVQEMITTRVSPEELSAALDYIKAFGKRQLEIESDPALRERLEERARQPK